jgi:hypothetical protein
MPQDDHSAGRPERARINTRHAQELRTWARKLDATPQQVKEAVQAVGAEADKVEEHLKGSRATTNSERVGEALRKPGGSDRAR